MTLFNTILKYAGIINEDTPNAYAETFYKQVVSKNLNQSSLDNVSFISFNNARIERAKRLNDNKQ